MVLREALKEHPISNSKILGVSFVVFHLVVVFYCLGVPCILGLRLFVEISNFSAWFVFTAKRSSAYQPYFPHLAKTPIPIFDIILYKEIFLVYMAES